MGQFTSSEKNTHHPNHPRSLSSCRFHYPMLRSVVGRTPIPSRSYSSEQETTMSTLSARTTKGTELRCCALSTLSAPYFSTLYSSPLPLQLIVSDLLRCGALCMGTTGSRRDAAGGATRCPESSESSCCCCRSCSYGNEWPGGRRRGWLTDNDEVCEDEGETTTIDVYRKREKWCRILLPVRVLNSPVARPVLPALPAIH